MVVATVIGAVVVRRHSPDVPYVPTPYEVVREMLKVAHVGPQDIVYDLGCGDGRIVITAVKEFKAKRGVGVDIDPDRIRECKENARKAGVTDRVQFLRQDLFQTDISEATVVAIYLSPILNLRLRPKLLRECRPGTRIVSHDFNMGDWKFERKLRVPCADRVHSVYYWIIPPRSRSK